MKPPFDEKCVSAGLPTTTPHTSMPRTNRTPLRRRAPRPALIQASSLGICRQPRAKPRNYCAPILSGRLTSFVCLGTALDFRHPGGRDFRCRELSTAEALFDAVSDISPVLERQGQGLLEDFLAGRHGLLLKSGTGAIFAGPAVLVELILISSARTV